MSDHKTETAAVGNERNEPESPVEVPTIRSEDLMRGRRELHILHSGRTYRLIRTRNDKLILQK